MRYQNWDALLFPLDSRIPLQEFDTKCFALDQNVRITTLQRATGLDMDMDNFESMILVPTVTCFVASLERNNPFRVSIHSWKPPEPSKLLQSYKTADERVMFEARIYIDGTLQAQHCFEDDNMWPEVIDEETRTGQAQPLVFPPFYKDVLQQAHWEPGDLVGRIRVVIAEGVVRDGSPQRNSEVAFDRLRDVVTFAFQHAPKDVLEYSNIAWPNTRIFGKILKQPTPPAPNSSRLPPVAVHSHSPGRLPIASRGINSRSNGLNSFQRILSAQTFSDLQSDPPITGTGNYLAKNTPPLRCGQVEMTANPDDPFVEPRSIASRAWRAQFRSSSHDVSMPDYMSNMTDHSRTHTSMSGVNFPGANFLKHMEEANPREIVQALSPAQQEQLMKELKAMRTPGQGTCAPTNTPRSLSGQNQYPLAVGRIRDNLSMRMSSNQGPTRRSSDIHCPTLHQGEQESRGSSSGSNGDNLEVLTGTTNDEKGQALSLSTNRSGSHSTLSKRKRHSGSPAINTTQTEDHLYVIVDSPTLETGGQMKACQSSASGGGVSLNID